MVFEMLIHVIQKDHDIDTCDIDKHDPHLTLKEHDIDTCDIDKLDPHLTHKELDSMIYFTMLFWPNI